MRKPTRFHLRAGSAASGWAVSSSGRIAVVVAAVCIGSLSLVRFGLSWRGAYGALFVGVLAWLGVHDLITRRIPNRVVVPAALLALAGRSAIEPDHALSWAIGGIGAGGALFALALANPAGLGMGDVKLALLLGFGLGRGVLGALFIGFVAAGLYGVALIAFRGTEARKTTFAFGPFLGAAGVVVFLLSG
jgi:leader peptidase (prepilin peptidase) / N-methyltransferase